MMAAERSTGFPALAVTDHVPLERCVSVRLRPARSVPPCQPPPGPFAVVHEGLEDDGDGDCLRCRDWQAPTLLGGGEDVDKAHLVESGQVNQVLEGREVDRIPGEVVWRDRERGGGGGGGGGG